MRLREFDRNGYHGDGERKKVVGVRLGETISFHFNWFCRGEPAGNHFSVMLNHGDQRELVADSTHCSKVGNSLD